MTSSLVLSAQAPTAFQDATRSLSPALDANEKGRRAGALSHGHPAHVGVHDDPQAATRRYGRTALHLWLAFPPVNWRGLKRSASLSRLHSHWLPSSSQATDRRTFLTSLAGVRRNSPERAVTGCAGAFHSVASRVSSTARLNTLAHEHVFHCLAHVPHLSSLSSSLFSSGIDPNERRLTNAKIRFAPGAKAND